MNFLKQLSGTLRYSMVLIVMLIFCNTLSAQEKGTITDPRDGRIYQWVKVGKKAWFAENLKYNVKPGSWFYNNDTANAVVYGRLYTWNAAMTACPKGWVLPADANWALLIEKLGGLDVSGGKFQEMDSVYWKANKNIPETAKTLSSLLGGVRHSDSTYTGVALWGGLWSATVENEVATNYLFAKGDKSIVKSSNDKNSAFGVRCVKK
ncbi:MAG: FISUMP domain-containing protein [Bacteroidota bacterium]